MSDENQVSRRRVLKVIAAGVGTAAALPLFDGVSLGQHQHQDGASPNGARAMDPLPVKPRFFTPHELATITAISEMIIPADQHSGGATAAGVPAFIDLMISESPAEVQVSWRGGLAAVDNLSQQKHSAKFVDCKDADRDAILKLISRNERRPRTVEEHFFIAIKGLTVDGYYTSEIGIHSELQYKGNAVLKEFVGCTHPEHMT